MTATITTSNDNNGATRTATANVGADSDDISPAVSQRICTHMNQDHVVTVLGMAQKALFLSAYNAAIKDINKHYKITNATMKKVTSKGCEIKIVSCSGDFCSIQTILYPFSKKCTTAHQIKQELIMIHSLVLQPNFYWLGTKPRCIVIITMDILLFIGLFLLKMTGGFVQGLFWFLVVAHLIEGSVGIYYCRFILKVNWITTLQWFICILPVGLPIMRELKDLCTILRQKGKNSNDSDSDGDKKVT